MKRKWYSIKVAEDQLWIDLVALAVVGCLSWTLIHAIITENLLG